MNVQKIIDAIKATESDSEDWVDLCVDAAEVLVCEGLVTMDADGDYDVDLVKLEPFPEIVKKFVSGMISTNTEIKSN